MKPYVTSEVNLIEKLQSVDGYGKIFPQTSNNNSGIQQIWERLLKYLRQSWDRKILLLFCFIIEFWQTSKPCEHVYHIDNMLHQTHLHVKSVKRRYRLGSAENVPQLRSCRLLRLIYWLTCEKTFSETNHPVMIALPDKSWKWCYIDDQYVRWMPQMK